MHTHIVSAHMVNIQPSEKGHMSGCKSSEGQYILIIIIVMIMFTKTYKLNAFMHCS